LPAPVVSVTGSRGLFHVCSWPGPRRGASQRGEHKKTRWRPRGERACERWAAESTTGLRRWRGVQQHAVPTVHAARDSAGSGKKEGAGNAAVCYSSGRVGAPVMFWRDASRSQWASRWHGDADTGQPFSCPRASQRTLQRVLDTCRGADQEHVAQRPLLQSGVGRQSARLL
jgi:hypothetical protein